MASDPIARETGLKGRSNDPKGVDFAFLGRGGVLLGNPRHYRDPHTEGILETAFALVPREDIQSAVALNSSVFNAARVVGPGIGGVVLATWGAGWAFALNAVSYVAVVIALLGWAGACLATAVSSAPRSPSRLRQPPVLGVFGRFRPG